MFSNLLSTLCSALVCIFSLLATASLAQTINVGPGQPHTTIQSGIDAAANGDTVLVAPGTYYENINFKGKAITVTSSGGAASTIIDGNATPGLAVVDFGDGETRSSVLSNFTVRNGGAVTFNSLMTTNAGGGIYIYNSSPTILNNVITGNACDGIESDSGTALIQGNTISATSFAENAYCSFQPVGIVLYGNQTSTTMTNSVIGNTIENNTSKVGDFGAAIYIWASNGNIIVGNTIQNNVSSLGAIQMYNSESIIFSQNLVYGNSTTKNVASYSGSGGLYMLIPDGSPPFYGLIANNTFANNTLSADVNDIGSQVYIDGDVSQFAFVNNILYGTGSSPLLVCNGAYAGLSPGPMLVENNDAFNPSGPAYDSSCVSGAGVAGNISSDPLFNNVANNDFHLRSGSPAIDAGNNQALTMLTPYDIYLTTDLDGKPRVEDATGKGCTIDMGVYEYPGTQSACFTAVNLTSSLNPSTFGQTVTFTAQLSSTNGVPTGAVEFTDGGTVLGIETISAVGVSTFSTGQLTIGSHPITATYQPTGSFAAATANLTQVVTGSATATTLACSPNSITIGDTALLNAAVTSTGGTPTGSIAFTDNGVAFTTQSLLNGAANFIYTGSKAGTHTLIATYVPTGAFSASSATCSVTVNLNPSTTTIASSLNPSSADQLVTFTATVNYATTPLSPPGPGSVTFSFNGTAAGTSSLVATSDPHVYTATIVTQTLPPGNNAITATLNPPIIYASSSASLTQVVNALPSTSVLTITPAAATFGTPVTLTATVSGTPPLIAGAPAPTGTVTFRTGATLLGTATLNAAGTLSTAVLNTGQLPVGNDPISCTYSGDTTYLPSPCNSLPITITSGTSALTITSSQNPSPAYVPVTFTIHLTLDNQPAPAGTQFTFSLMNNSGNVLLTTDANGTVTYTTSQLFARTWDITAIFTSTNYVTAVTHYSQVVTAVATTLSLTAAPNPAYIGQAVRLAASTTPSNTTFPTGTVTFLEGATVLGTGALNSAGQASFSISTLALGTHTIIATYPGDSGFLSSTSQTISVLILPQGFTLSLSAPTISIVAGHYKPFSANVQSFGGFTGSVQLTCTAPQNVYLTCDVSNAQLQLAADSSVTSAMTLDTNVLLRFGASLESGPRHTTFGSRTIVFAMLFPLPLAFLLRRRKLRALPLVLLLFSLGATLSLTGCGNKYPAQTPPGVYDIVVNATGTSTGSTVAVTQTVHMQLTVTPK